MYGGLENEFLQATKGLWEEVPGHGINSSANTAAVLEHGRRLCTSAVDPTQTFLL
jgi:hypothetical protein